MNRSFSSVRPKCTCTCTCTLAHLTRIQGSLMWLIHFDPAGLALVLLGWLWSDALTLPSQTHTLFNPSTYASVCHHNQIECWCHHHRTWGVRVVVRKVQSGRTVSCVCSALNWLFSFPFWTLESYVFHFFSLRLCLCEFRSAQIKLTVISLFTHVVWMFDEQQHLGFKWLRVRSVKVNLI